MSCLLLSQNEKMAKMLIALNVANNNQNHYPKQLPQLKKTLCDKLAGDWCGFSISVCRQSNAFGPVNLNRLPTSACVLKRRRTPRILNEEQPALGSLGLSMIPGT